MKTNLSTALFCIVALMAGCASPDQTTTDKAPASAKASAVKPREERPPGTFSVVLPDEKQEVYGRISGNFDRAPVPRLQATAIFPVELYDQGITGSAVVTFTLAADGTSKDFSAEGTREEFCAAALAAAKKNKYKLAMKASKPVECRIELQYLFPGPFVRGRVDTRPDGLKFVVRDK